MNGHHEMTQEGLTAAMARLDAFIDGQADEGSVYENFDGLDFDALQKEIKEELPVARRKDRMRLHLKLALLRDLRHGVSSSVTAHSHGILQERRQLHEARRQLLPYNDI